MDSTISVKALKTVLDLIDKRKEIIHEKTTALRKSCQQKHNLPDVVVDILVKFVWHPQLLVPDDKEGAIPQTAVFITATFDQWTRMEAEEHLRLLEGPTKPSCNTVFVMAREFASVYDLSSFMFRRVHEMNV